MTLPVVAERLKSILVRVAVLASSVSPSGSMRSTNFACSCATAPRLTTARSSVITKNQPGLLLFKRLLKIYLSDIIIFPGY